MNKVKKLTVALLVLVIGLFAGFSLVACGRDEAPKVNITVSDVSGTFTYDGEAQTPALEVKDGKTLLVADTHYTLTYANNVNAGTASVTVTFIGKYKKEKPVEKTFTIGALDVSNLATLTVADVAAGATPTATVALEGFTLVAGTDYDVNFGDYSQVAESVTATATFKGNFTGSVTDTYAVASVDASEAVVALANASEKIVYTQNPAGARPSGLVVTLGGETIDASSYDVTYENNYEVGTATAIVTFKGNYAGTATVDYTIVPFEVTSENAEFTVEDVTIGEEPNPWVYVDGYLVQPARPMMGMAGDFTMDLGSYNQLGEATAKVTFTGNFSGELTATYTVKAIDANSAVVALADPTAPIVYNANPYTGTTVDVVVTLGGETIDATNYA